MRPENWIAVAFLFTVGLLAYHALQPTRCPSAPNARVRTGDPDYDLVLTLHSPRDLGNPPRVLEYIVRLEGIYETGRRTEILREFRITEDPQKPNPLFRKAGVSDPDLRLAFGPKGALSPGTYHVHVKAKNGTGHGPTCLKTVHLEAYQCGHMHYTGHLGDGPAVFVL